MVKLLANILRATKDLLPNIFSSRFNEVFFAPPGKPRTPICHSNILLNYLTSCCVQLVTCWHPVSGN